MTRVYRSYTARRAPPAPRAARRLPPAARALVYTSFHGHGVCAGLPSWQSAARARLMGSVRGSLQDGSIVHFKIKTTCPLKKLKETYCLQKSLQMHQTRFVFDGNVDGNRLGDTQTPGELDMEDDDVINVISALELDGDCTEAGGSETAGRARLGAEKRREVLDSDVDDGVDGVAHGAAAGGGGGGGGGGAGSRKRKFGGGGGGATMAAAKAPREGRGGYAVRGTMHGSGYAVRGSTRGMWRGMARGGRGAMRGVAAMGGESPNEQARRQQEDEKRKAAAAANETLVVSVCFGWPPTAP